tara:strand:- start:3474 stop:4532 length:1059 start_codon:yes stop_codon:yes gene_type:complete
VKSDPFTNNIESLFEPTDQEIVLYNHLDTLFPRSDQKFIEYKKYMPEDYFWHPYDWGHKNGHIFYEHTKLNNFNSKMTERMRSDFLMYFEQRNLKIPRAARKNIENLDYPKKLNRWREVGDLWLIKSNITENGYATILITSIKQKNGIRYIEFILADSDLNYATDLDLFIEKKVHSNLSYDIVVYEDLDGILFEEDSRFLHKIGRVKPEFIEKIEFGNTINFRRGNPIFSESNKRFRHRKIKEFEASILSKDALNWLSTGEVNFQKLNFNIEIVKGLNKLEEDHAKLNFKNLDFNEIKRPYINHLFKLHSTFGDNLIIASDIELEEEKELVIVNTVDNTETIIEMEFYNENS